MLVFHLLNFLRQVLSGEESSGVRLNFDYFLLGAVSLQVLDVGPCSVHFGGVYVLVSAAGDVLAHF